MWDVIWTDPERELVGEHRAKKDDAKKSKAKTSSSDSRSGRTSVSTTTTTTNSSRSSSLEIPLSIFRSNRGGFKRSNFVSASITSSSSSSAGGGGGGGVVIESPLMNAASTATRSPLSRSTFDDGVSSSGRQSSSGRASASTSFERRVDDSPLCGSHAPLKKADSACNISPSPSNSESIFSLSAKGILDHSPMTESEKIKSIIQLLEHSDLLTTPADTGPFPETRKRDDIKASSPAAPLTPPRSPSHPRILKPSQMKLDIAFSPTTPVPPLKSPFRTAAPKWYLPVMPNNPDAWKISGQWDPATPVSPPKSASELVKSSSSEILKPQPEKKETAAALPSFERLREEVVRMASADAKDVLSRLTELWEKTRGMDLEHLLGTSEQVLEMRRWMLSAMNHLDLPVSAKKRTSTAAEAQSPTTARMVLVLYESSITVTYLAALHPSKQFYDISTSSSSTTTHDQFDSIRHIPISSISPADFPVAQRIFEAVVSHTLPSQCPSAALLPGILRAVHRSLKPGGALLLTLIDPLPRAGTMGPRMRAWIEAHLLRNLARQSRCMSPSTLFPRVLGEVNLRGRGSTLTTTKFYAVPESATSRQGAKYPNDDDDDDDDDVTSPEARKMQQESEVKAQVRSLVGRMLWTQVWGPHVTARKWWWEDQACVQECLQLGTFWEYHAIRAVKGSEA